MDRNNRFYAHYLSKDSFEKCVKEKRQADIDYKSTLLIDPIEYFDQYSFRANILEPSEKPGSLLIFDSNQNWDYVKYSSLRSRTYYIDYVELKPGVFTFDGITFYRLLDVRPMPGNEAQFFFRQIEKVSYCETNLAFMIMPFHSEKLNEFYIRHIRDFLKENMAINIIRADDFSDNDVIIDTIFKQIEKSEFILSEITDCNKNVFFEIGYARGIKKEIIFLSRRNCDLKFFDVNHIRRIEYDIENPEVLQERLCDTIRNIREKIN